MLHSHFFIQRINKMSFLKFFALLILAIGVSTAFDDDHVHFLRRGLFHRLHQLDPPKHFKDIKSSEDQWFEQRLDHFNPMNVNSWQQRYFSR